MVVSLEKTGFAFSEVVEILAKMFKVHTDRRDTFVSRLQQLQKMGLPAQANVGRGAKVRYVNWQIADLALMLDLLDCGITPGTLKDYFRPHDRNFIGVYTMGGHGWLVQESLKADAPDLYWLFRFNSLGYLKSGASVHDDDTAHPLDRQDYGRSSDTLLAELENGPAVTINMTARLRRLRDAVAAVYPERLEDVTFYPTQTGLKENEHGA